MKKLKPLTLKKQTITSLNDQEMNSIHGGDDPSNRYEFTADSWWDCQAGGDSYDVDPNCMSCASEEWMDGICVITQGVVVTP